MANTEKGEVGFEAEGKSFTLLFDIDAICNLENALDAGVFTIGQSMQDPARMRLSTVRAGLLAGLRRYHPNITLADASRIMQSVGVVKSIELFNASFAAAFPEPADGPLAVPTSQPNPTAGGGGPT